MKKRILKINSSGELVQWNHSLNRWEIVSRSWNWTDITAGYRLESKRNYKLNNRKV